MERTLREKMYYSICTAVLEKHLKNCYDENINLDSIFPPVEERPIQYQESYLEMMEEAKKDCFNKHIKKLKEELKRKIISWGIEDKKEFEKIMNTVYHISEYKNKHVLVSIASGIEDEEIQYWVYNNIYQAQYQLALLRKSKFRDHFIRDDMVLHGYAFYPPEDEIEYREMWGKVLNRVYEQI